MESSIYVVLLILVNVAIWVILSLIPRLKNKNKIFLVLSFISLWVFLTIREPYSDMIAYEKYFKTLNTSSFEVVFVNRWEILFKVLLFMIRLITSDTHVMMGIIALITLAGPFLFIKRYSNNYLLAIVMFIAFGSFHIQFYILRQAIALSIVLMAFHFIGEKKFFKYCLAIVIAALFHKTSCIMLLLYPIVNIPPSRYKNVAMGIVMALGVIFSSQLSNFLMIGFYDEYTERVNFGNGIGMLLLYVCMYMVYLLLKRWRRTNEKEEITKGNLFAIIMQFFAVINNCFSRLVDYVRDSFVIAIPNSVQQLNAKNRMLLSVVVIIACVLFVLITGNIEGYSICFLNG
ncbi:EpsG family protein [Candidatus Saccharibacteria bacterium]|nr:EpsG family protein [Candidatus Saccharibacteria bacterium]